MDDLRTFEVPGDPEACRGSAQRLDALAGVGADTARFLDRQRQGTWGLAGLSADAYRRRCAVLGDEADDLSRRTGLLSTALTDLADELARAQGLMARAERWAAGAGLVVAGTLVPPSGPPSWAPGGDAAAWTAWTRARSQIRRARTIELAAQQAWRLALDRWATRSLEHDLPGAGQPPMTPPAPPPGGSCQPTAGATPPPPREPRPRELRPGEREPVPDLEPWTCGFTPPDPPEPDSFCGTPDDLSVTDEPPRRPGVNLPGVDLPGVRRGR